jgi:hypothetical protein
MSATSAKAASDTGRFRLPAQGRVLSSGRSTAVVRRNGCSNDRRGTNNCPSPTIGPMTAMAELLTLRI